MKNQIILNPIPQNSQDSSHLIGKVIATLLFAAMVLLSFSMKGQENNYLKRTIPPSPSAAALGEYGDHPISLFSGTPNISIPIYELTAKGISVPISLSYNASGIKVEQTASNVGLGWSLNAGGVITRTIKGKADGLDTNDDLFPSRSYLPIQVPPYKTSYDAVADAASETGVIDTEPDIFHYNFNGRSGSFYLDKDANVILTQYEDIHIELITTGTNDYKFEVTTEEGNQYHFEDTEDTNGKITSWFLSRIKNANQTDSIDFYYDYEDFTYSNPARFSEYYVPDGSQTLRLLSGGDLPIALADRQCRNISILGKRLVRIESTNMGTVEFLPSNTPRKDVIQGSQHGAFALSEIIIKDVHQNPIKSFALESSFMRTEHEYVEVIGFQCPQNKDFMNYRLYLDKIIESDEKIHSFTYHGRTEDCKDLLPNRLSPAQDWSGFYNGENQNENLRPTFFGYLSGGSDVEFNQCTSTGDGFPLPSGQVTILGAKRDASYPEVTYGTLQSIVYPTGGSTEFEYELHDQSVIGENGGIRINEITNKNISGEVLRTKTYAYQQPLPGYGKDFFGYTYYAAEKKQISEIPLCGSIGDQDDDYQKTFKINTGPYNDIGAFSGSHIGYKYVWESELGNGSTAYTFTGFPYSDSEEYVIELIGYSPWWVEDGYPEGVDYGSHVTYEGSWPAGPNSNNSWKRGILKSKYVVDVNGNPVSGEEFLYDHIEMGSAHGIKILTLKEDLAYLYFQFSFKAGWNKLVEKRNYYYDAQSGEEVANSETYEYTSSFHKQPTKKTILRSTGEALETTLLYPTDLSSLPNTPTSVLSEMASRNMIAPVIKSETQTTSGTFLSGQIVNYEETNGVITENSIETKKTGTYEPRAEFKFDASLGNLLENKLTNGSPIIYIWGYNRQYPIAKIENVPYADITSYVSNLETKSDEDNDRTVDTHDNNGNRNYVGEEGELRQALDALRSNLPQAMVSTYTYDPLIGITSMTDPRGYTIYYEYDNLNRLKEVRDAGGNLVSDYEYHYANLND